MPTKMNEACTLKPRRIVKNPSLTLGLSAKHAGKHKKVADAYGNVAPVTVGAPKNGGHMILTGSSKLEACAQAGISSTRRATTAPKNMPSQTKVRRFWKWQTI